MQVDRAKVLSHGQSTSGKLLVELQVRKSTADGVGAKQFYNDLTTPLPGWDTQIREIVISKKQVRNTTYMPQKEANTSHFSASKDICAGKTTSTATRCCSDNL